MQFSCFVNHKNNESISKSCQQKYDHVHRQAKNSKTQWFRHEDHASWRLWTVRLICGRAIHFMKSKSAFCSSSTYSDLRVIRCPNELLSRESLLALHISSFDQLGPIPVESLLTSVLAGPFQLAAFQRRQGFLCVVMRPLSLLT